MINEFEKFKNIKLKELDSIRQQKIKFKEIESNYARLRDKLVELPNEIEYDVFVPIAYSSGDNLVLTSGGLVSKNRNQDIPLAFMPGKLIHTNEILVHLGDNWFTQRSAKQSTEIAQRKLERCKEQLQNLEKSEKLITDWLDKIDELKDNRELVEIHEEYNEAEERKWREKHRENVRKHKEKERLEREAASGGGFQSATLASVVERDPVKEMSKLTLTEPSSSSEQPTNKPISKFKQQMLNKRK